jgi:polyhydroxyalkanoate synthase
MLRSETAAQPARMQHALAGLRKYQEAERTSPRPPMPALAERLGATLRDYGLRDDGGTGRPVLFVPSLINPPSILDLEGKSLLRWLAGEGVRPLLVDWGWNVGARAGLSVADHVTEVLLPLLDELGEDVTLVGYCLGGTMAFAAAALRPVKGVAAIAAPWRFSGFPDEARARLAALWAAALPTAERLGLLPMEALQSAFWALDPARTVRKFEAYAAMPAASEEARRFVILEDWANDGPPLAGAAARELFETLFRDDAPGRGAWRVGGRAVDPAALPCPVLDLVSTSDRIVPAASASGAGERRDLASGHVGMVIGGRAEAELWRPLAAWLSRTAAG